MLRSNTKQGIPMTAGCLILITSLFLPGGPGVAAGVGADSLLNLSALSATGFAPANGPAPLLVGSLFSDRWDLSTRLASIGLQPALEPVRRDTWMDPPAGLPESVNPKPDRLFFTSWRTLTIFELGLLGLTASMPRDWTGWSEEFVSDAMDNLHDAYTKPPVWDTDWWFHNYVGHPYGGSVYYNTVRCRGASKTESFLFATLMSTQWEFVFEAVAEQPSIQDLFITPVTGWILGELIHNLTLGLTIGGVNLIERVLLTVLNPMHAVYVGF